MAIVSIQETLARPNPLKIRAWEPGSIIGIMIPHASYAIRHDSGLEEVKDVTDLPRYGRAMIPKTVNKNFDREAYPCLAEISDALEAGELSPYGLYLKDNSYFSWHEYEAYWVHCVPTDIIGDFPLSKKSLEDTGVDGVHKESDATRSVRDIIDDLAPEGLRGQPISASGEADVLPSQRHRPKQYFIGSTPEAAKKE